MPLDFYSGLKSHQRVKGKSKKTPAPIATPLKAPIQGALAAAIAMPEIIPAAMPSPPESA